MKKKKRIKQFDFELILKNNSFSFELSGSLKSTNLSNGSAPFSVLTINLTCQR